MNEPAADHTAIRPGIHRVAVVSAASITPLMRRVIVRAPSLATLPLRPAQDVGLVFADAAGREIRRRYTITRVDGSELTFALDGVLHDQAQQDQAQQDQAQQDQAQHDRTDRTRQDARDTSHLGAGDALGATGPGAAWFRNSAPGDEIDVVGPRGRIALAPGVASHLFVGDESGLPAFGELLASLPGGARAMAVIEVASAAEEQPLPSPADTDVRWVHRDGRPAGRPELLADALRAVGALAGPAQAYVLGESRAVVALHPVLAELGVGRAETFVKGYWNRPRGQ